MTHSLRHRHREPEWMDQPDIDPSLHDRALDSLTRLNRWAQSGRILWPAIRDLAMALPDRTCRALDLATGAGDVPAALCRRAALCGITLEFTAIDVSGRAIEYARRSARRSLARINFIQGDALRDELPAGAYDVVMCSLFLHHLVEGEAALLLRRMMAASRRLVLVSDLRRSAGGLWLTHLAARLLTRSPVVRVDGPRSVRAAFRRQEAESIARQAGWTDFDVRSVWPFRFLLTGRKGRS